MFLALTADSRFWDEEQAILFLGEWCKLYSRRDELASLNAEVLPYLWYDKTKFKTAFDRLETVYDKYLSYLTESLNKIHKVNYSKHYWQIVLGFWLNQFMDVCYERFCQIESAAASGKVTDAALCDLTPTRPQKHMSYAHDPYNLYIYSRIIDFLKPFPYRTTGLAWQQIPEPKPQQSKLKRFFSEVVRQLRKGPETFLRQGSAVLLIEWIPQLFKRMSSEVVFVGSMYIPLLQQIRLQLGLKQLPYLYQGKKTPPMSTVANEKMREALTFPESDDPFEQFLNQFIPDEMPMNFLENYQASHNRAMALGPKNPKVIITAFSVNYRDCFEFWAAYNVEKNHAKLILSQHGGGYGSARYGSVEQHFLRTFDKYCTWGSTLSNNPKTVPMPSFRLSCLRKKLKHYHPDGPILLLATSMPRYKIFFETCVAGPKMLGYVEQQKQFLQGLDKGPHALLIWRYFNNLWNEVDRIKDFDPTLSVQHGLKKQLGKASDFITNVQRSRLTIHTANETTYLETLAANFPTVAFWDPSVFEVREELQSVFDCLIEAKILHYSPESAAEHVNQIYNDPQAWWQLPKTQAAREQFCNALANTSDTLIDDWQQLVDSLKEG